MKKKIKEAFQGEKMFNGKPVKLLNPPTNCLSPIEEMLIKKGLSKTIDSRYATTMTRVPNVSLGNPYQVEVITAKKHALLPACCCCCCNN